jgi:hypothetical protein
VDARIPVYPDLAGKVAAATGSSRVGDGGQIGEQAWGVGVLEGLGVGEMGQGGRGWD